MINELFVLFLLSAMLLMIYRAGQIGKDWLIRLMVFNITMSNIFAAKTILFFGLSFPMNIAFYTPTFIITAILVRNYGRKVADTAIFISVVMVMCLFVFSFIALQPIAVSTSVEGAQALSIIFDIPLLIFFAGLIGYTFAQLVYVRIYEILPVKNKCILAVRVLIINLIVQALAAFIFYPFVFYTSEISLGELLPLVLTGWLMQVAIITLMSPVIFAHYRAIDKK